MQSFEFKPALLRRRNHWTLDSGMLTRNGELYCSLADVRAVRFGEARSQRGYSAWLELTDGTARRRIACALPRGSEQNQRFAQLNAAIMGALSDISPGLEVSIGAGRSVQWAMVLVGAFAALFGAVILGLALAGALPGGKTLLGAVAGAGALLLGSWLVLTFRPGSQAQTLSLSEARNHVLSLAQDKAPAGAKHSGQ